MQIARAVNLGVKFLLELGAVGAFGYWGATTGSGALSPLLAIAVPCVAIGVWSVFAAPNSQRRLPQAARIPLELSVFALAGLALYSSASRPSGVVFGAVVAVNAGLLALLGDPEPER